MRQQVSKTFRTVVGSKHSVKSILYQVQKYSSHINYILQILTHIYFIVLVNGAEMAYL